MGSLRQTDATLRFFGDDLDPEEVTALLGAIPTIGVRKGATWTTTRGREIVARTGSWRLNSPARRQPGDLESQIAELLAPLTSDLRIWGDLTTRFRGDIFCGLFLNTGNDGADLSASLLKMIGERGLLLDLDIYEQDAG